MKRVLSAIQPNGNLHLGNYLGAIKNWVDFQNDEYENLYCLADLHAITVWHDPKDLHKSIYESLAAIIAAGIDPQKSTLFCQSHVASHSELAWVFMCTARIGWLNRMTQFKEKAGKNKEKASVGLYAYPVLMAADILSYRATHVPVGEDQKQHLELARDIAQKFNNDFETDFFPSPEPIIQGPVPRVMSLRDGKNKMSKSDPSEYSRINLTDDEDQIRQKIRKAKTDPHPLPDSVEELGDRPEAQNLLRIYAGLSGQPLSRICSEEAGSEFSSFKGKLADLMVEKMAPISYEMKKILKEKEYLDQILKEGAEKAIEISSPIIEEVYKIMGLR